MTKWEWSIMMAIARITLRLLDPELIIDTESKDIQLIREALDRENEAHT